MALQLVTNDRFSEIRHAWDVQCKSFDETIEEYAPSFMEHAGKLAANLSPNSEYSIFAANLDGDCACILHVNRARLPGTTGVTQKVMWILLAPKYDYEDVTPELIAAVAAEIISGAIDLCKTEGKSDHIKIHMGNLADRQFFTGVAYGLQTVKSLKDVSIRGNWLHMSLA
jgi:hypothetical protein